MCLVHDSNNSCPQISSCKENNSQRVPFQHTRQFSSNHHYSSLKLGNLLLGIAFDIKVADFGLAAKIEHDGEKRRTICGTPNYIAPEVLDKKIGHSYEVDIWSLGVIW